MNIFLIYGLLTIIPGILLFLITIFGGDSDVEADADTDISIDAGDFEGPGKLSVKLILFFLVGLGAAGYMSAYFKWPVPHFISGIIGGTIAWFAGYQILKLLYKQQASSQVNLGSFVGKQGRVIVPIPKGGTGEIEAANDETAETAFFNAKSAETQKEYLKGDTVTIKSVSGKTAIVG